MLPSSWASVILTLLQLLVRHFSQKPRPPMFYIGHSFLRPRNTFLLAIWDHMGAYVGNLWAAVCCSDFGTVPVPLYSHHPGNPISFSLICAVLPPAPMARDDDADRPQAHKKKRVRKTYSCSCSQFCHGRAVMVSKTTYFRHQTMAKVAAAAKAVTSKMGGKRKEATTGADDSSMESNPHKRVRTAEEDAEDAEMAQEFYAHDEELPLPRAHSRTPEDCSNEHPHSSTRVDTPPVRLPVTVEDVPEEDEPAEPNLGSIIAEDEPAETAERAAVEEEMEEVPVTMDDMKRALDFIKLLKGASLDSFHAGLSAETRDQLRNPPQQILEIDEPHVLMSIELYVTLNNVSQHYYEDVRKLFMKHNPDVELLSYHQVKRKVEILTGIVPIVNDMCVDSCVGFTGPYVHLDSCPKCKQPRYDELKTGTKPGAKKVPRKQFFTMALGQEIQAVFRTREGAESMAYLSSLVEEVLTTLEQDGTLDSFDDISHGSRFWGAYAAGQISSEDVVVALSIDGAQLHRNKKSDCWIYIWVILSLGPDKRYRKKYVLPGAVIPGPNHPKDLDSFLFPGLYHVSALMREGLNVWDAAQNSAKLVQIFLALVLADGPAMALLSGMVGHSGRRGCRLYCPLIGRRKPNTGNYYPVLLRPIEPYGLAGSCHPDVSRNMCLTSPSELSAEYEQNLSQLLTAQNPHQYEQLRRETGLTKPSIFSGLSRMFDLPGCFPIDYMHLVALNITDLFLGLWRGTLSGSKDTEPRPWAVLQGDTWLVHGSEVGRAAHFLPGSFDRPPRNIAEKLNSGYKAKEFMTYYYGYGPALLRRHLPRPYLKNFAKFVSAGRTLGKHRISLVELDMVDTLTREAEVEYESLYYGREAERLHLVRPCIHTFGHGPSEVKKIGPLIGVTQYTMERTIGNLGQELRQHSTLFANLSHRALLRCQINALGYLMPSLGPEDQTLQLPKGAQCLGNNLVLLCPKDSTSRWVTDSEAAAFYTYLTGLDERPSGAMCEFSLKVRKYARLRLPNGQVARSAWKETLKPLANSRIARIVKVMLDGKMEIAEVRYYCRLPMSGTDTFRTVAMLSIFGARDEELFADLYGTVWLAPYRGDQALRVADVSHIHAVVAMVPDSDVVVDLSNPVEPHYQPGCNYFLVEKLGLEVSHRTGTLENEVEDE
ncbi:hypothetical protein NUW54_g116 [Trametes sanguinea]|uniref:Uncharacterized protein n=1 Tax=Trametes sanguinea TaxID=158606 RepID=A0ACC1QCJ3_9APHY|nr:hypothetical protein NUW54_g116 [Trametes sanguinea]